MISAVPSTSEVLSCIVGPLRAVSALSFLHGCFKNANNVYTTANDTSYKSTAYEMYEKKKKRQNFRGSNAQFYFQYIIIAGSPWVIVRASLYDIRSAYLLLYKCMIHMIYI